MPVDYKSAAAALSLSPSPVADRNPNATPASKLGVSRYADHSGGNSSGDYDEDGEENTRTSWSRSSRNTSHNRHRLSTTTSRHQSFKPTSVINDTIQLGQNLISWAINFYSRLSQVQKILLFITSTVLGVLVILSTIYSHALFSWFASAAATWRSYSWGWIVIFLGTCATAFPPMIGYSTAVTTAGFVYGFPLGWPIAAGASVVGSTAAFVASRGVLAGYVHGLVGKDKRFVALGQVLKRDGVGTLALVRFCPLPFSLSNGFLATVPEVGVGGFAAATALASPKLLVHVFIGSRLAYIAEHGDDMPFSDKLINYTFMTLSGLVGMAVGIFIYKRTMARAAQLSLEEEEEDLEGGVRRQGSGFSDEDHEARGMMDPNDADAAALMDDDDLSLWDQGDDAYVDEVDGRTDR